jgi:succinyl-CoA synthetase beta subunit
MYVHEYQAKALLGAAGVPIPVGRVAASPEEARRLAPEVPGARWVVKAQVHSGGRGKAGGVVLCDSPDAVAEAAKRLIGTRLVTNQTGSVGLPVESIFIEEVRPIAAEFYLCALIDRTRARVTLIASASGGADIEEVAQDSPEKIITVEVHPAAGLQSFHLRTLGYGIGLEGDALRQFSALTRALYDLCLAKDLLQVEINPLAMDGNGHLMALDAKIVVDDNALSLHADLAALRDVAQEDPTEAKARDLDLSYVTLDGSIGCMVNGAGLAMATLDVIKLHGGQPANFLDVGGGITKERVAAAFRLILSEPRVKAILVNIFGGIVRCDLIAEGVIEAARETGAELPIVVRLEGTNAEEGRALLQQSGLALIPAATLDEAAIKAVEVVQ